MEDKRAVERFDLPYNVPVHDHESGETIGHVADISLHGAQVLSIRALDLNRIYQLSLKLPEELLGKDHAVLEARCVWCRKESSATHHTAGFDFLRRGPLIEGVVSQIFEHSAS